MTISSKIHFAARGAKWQASEGLNSGFMIEVTNCV